MTAFRILIILIYTAVFIFLVGFLAFKVLTPLLLFPDDPCYYHFNTPPAWVSLFYLDSSGHVDTFNGFHSLTIILISLIAGIYFGIKTDKFLLKKYDHLHNKSQIPKRGDIL